MPFLLRLILPIHDGVDHSLSEGLDNEAEELIDDDTASPSFLVTVCRSLAERGIRFELSGLFEKPLPVTTETDLVYFLEQLPALLEFLQTPSMSEFNLSFWGQGIETQLAFFKRNSDRVIEVTATSSIWRAMASPNEHVSRSDFVDQIVAFVETYDVALKRYLPNLVNNPWNKRLLIGISRLKPA